MLLCAQDGAAFRKIVGSDHVPILLVCDHASNRVPLRLGDLGGIAVDDMNRHIAWDVGAARVTELIAERLRCTAVLCQFSRLVVDVNRDPKNLDFIVRQSDGTLIPANYDLTEEDRLARETEIFIPFQNAVAAAIQQLEKKHSSVAAIAIHSFTPQMRGNALRPWKIGVVWNKDAETASKLINYLEKIPDMVVGDNEPYSMKTNSGYTLEHHAEGKRPSILLEIRNDLIRDEKGCVQYANLIADFFATPALLRQ